MMSEISNKTKFKQTEIGKIPEDWEVKEAEHFCIRVTDGTHGTPKRQSSGKYLITSRHLKEGTLDFENAYYISEEDFQEISRRSKVEQWDVIISMIGTVGLVHLERNKDVNYAIKNVGLFKVKEDELKGKWLYYYLRSGLSKEYIFRNKRGTTQEYIPLGSLRKFPITFPKDRQEMKKIILILESIENKISLNQRMNKTLEAIAQAIFKHWFIDFEFPNEEGKSYKSSGGEMVYNEELGKEMPKGWKVGTIGDVLELRYGKGLPERKRRKGYFPVVGSNGIIGFHDSYLVDGPGIVIGRKGTLGAVHWIDENFFPIDTTFYVTPKINIKSLYYFYFLLKGQEFLRMSSDSAVPGLNRNLTF